MEEPALKVTGTVRAIGVGDLVSLSKFVRLGGKSFSCGSDPVQILQERESSAESKLTALLEDYLTCLMV